MRKIKRKKVVEAFEDRQSIYDSPQAGGFILVSSLFPTKKNSTEDRAKALISSSSWFSSKLTKMMFLYDSLLWKGLTPTIAQNKLWDLIERWTKEGRLSKKEKAILHRAEKHDPEAVRILIHANPEAIRLPFVLDSLIDLLKNYKSAPKGTLKPIKQQWIKLLPIRSKNAVPYSDSDITGFLLEETMLNRKNPSARTAKYLNISRQKVRQVKPLKSYPGRLKQ